MKTGNLFRCVFCFKVYEEEIGNDGFPWIGRTEQGFPKYQECGCVGSVKFKSKWKRDGMKRGFTSAIPSTGEDFSLEDEQLLRESFPYTESVE